MSKSLKVIEKTKLEDTEELRLIRLSQTYMFLLYFIIMYLHT